MNEIQTNILARSVYKSIQSFYSEPENMKKFEEWKKEREKKGKN